MNVYQHLIEVEVKISEELEKYIGTSPTVTPDKKIFKFLIVPCDEDNDEALYENLYGKYKWDESSIIKEHFPDAKLFTIYIQYYTQDNTLDWRPYMGELVK